MVAVGPELGDVALQRPPRNQPQRRKGHRQRAGRHFDPVQNDRPDKAVFSRPHLGRCVLFCATFKVDAGRVVPPERCGRLSIKDIQPMQDKNRIFSILCVGKERLFTYPVTTCWTPNFHVKLHSGDGVRHERRHFVEGWTAQQSDRYARVSRLKTANLQRAVVRSIAERPVGGPLGKVERRLLNLRLAWIRRISPGEAARCVGLLEVWKLSKSLPHPSRLVTCSVEQEDLDVLPAEEVEEPSQPRADKRTAGSSSRTERLGDDPKASRSEMRESLEDGFHISWPGKRKIRALHQFGSCWMVPNIDSVQFQYMGTHMPRQSQYDPICQLCGNLWSVQGRTSRVELKRFLPRPPSEFIGPFSGS